MELAKIQLGSNKYLCTTNGTCYHANTKRAMITQLETLRASRIRCRFHWGDATTGKDWCDRYGITGTIGRSTGEMKVPLLIYNKRSIGGGAILTHCIVKITAAKGGRVIYQHPNYHI